MGKLILGIIAVVLLQFAFFIYMARDGRVDPNAGVARTISGEPNSRLSAVSVSPKAAIRVVSATPSDADSPRSKKKRAIAAGPARAGVRERSDPRDQVRNMRRFEAKPAIARAGLRKSVEPEYPLQRTSAFVPRGHTVVIVDYLRVRTAPEARYVVKPRKRSYLARTLTPLVKKPWKWMKSLASKLD